MSVSQSGINLPDRPEVWGGVEYTHNRVGNICFDQIDLSGHSRRLEDYDLFADHGLRSVRCGLLWERHAVEPSWSWSDERLSLLRRAGIRPIAGLVHHGSGPLHTNLLDAAFPLELAQYARAVAERYPWIDAYTPVNEPHTTARFSGMYGVWYPHHRTKSSYLAALLRQMRATVLSMQAIRQVNSDALLIQTEDFGAISGTAPLRAVWELMNERRWLPFDLLCGRVNRQHSLYQYLTYHGLGEEEILWFVDHPCPPDLIGVNYYLTSDRFLDSRLSLYPDSLRSSEGPFVDVEALRVGSHGIRGFAEVLQEAWLRYKIPLALTEVHLGGSVEDQIRWAVQAWRDVCEVRRRGIDCRALTFWAWLGSYYWNELVTRNNGHYEPGVFDVRLGRPLPTELSGIVKQLTRGEEPRHACLSEPGWWATQDRVSFPEGLLVA